jgi:uncharacterized phage-like protein YoqJ
MTKVLTVTGYKSFELGIQSDQDPRVTIIKKALEKKLIGLLEEGLEWVIVSGQLGVELWCAEVCLDLQERYDFQIGIIAPFEEQDSRWKEPDQEKYQLLTMTVDYFNTLYQGGYKNPGQFKMKNQFFLSKADASLVLIDEDYPGSVKFYVEALEKETNHPMFTITPLDLEDTGRELQELAEFDS